MSTKTPLKRKHQWDDEGMEPVAGQPAKAARHTGTFLKFTGTETVDLFVGPQKELYRVHKHVICQKIPYFDNVFNRSEGPRQIAAEFPDDSPIAFDILLEWAYQGHLRPVTSETHPSRSMYDVCVVYFLFEKLKLHKLMNSLMDMIRNYQRIHNGFFSSHTIRRVYQNTTVNSPLRKYCLHTLHYVIEKNPTRHINCGFTSTELTALLQESPGLLNDHVTLMIQQHGKLIENPNLIPDSEYHAEVS